ncbi:MAG: hypothetical protein ACRD2C_17770 [Acidimicrobiales bacterium]
MSDTRSIQASEIGDRQAPIRPEPWLGDVLLLVMASVITVLLTLLVSLLVAGA